MVQDDPFVAALDEEFRSIGIELANTGLSEEEAFVSAYHRSLMWRNHEISKVKAASEARITQLQNQIRNIISYRSPEVARVVRTLLHGKSKSFKTLYGAVGLRAKAEQLTWQKEHEAELITWARTNCPNAISVSDPQPVTSLKKTKLVAHLQDTGEQPPMTEHVSACDELYTRDAKENEDDQDSEG